MPPKRSPLVELFEGLAAVFDDLGVRWYLFGAQAALLYGAGRLTADVDVTVDPADLGSDELVRALDRAGFGARVEDPVGFAAKTRVLPLVHEASGIPVDVVLAGPGLEALFLSRAAPRDIEGVRVPVASAEDLVAMKILAGRAKDLDDAVAVLAARGEDLDLATIRETLEILEAALSQSDLLPRLEESLARARRG